MIRLRASRDFRVLSRVPWLRSASTWLYSVDRWLCSCAACSRGCRTFASIPFASCAIFLSSCEIPIAAVPEGESFADLSLLEQLSIAPCLDRNPA